MSLIYEKRVHSLEDRVDELERRVPDDLAAFIDELVERTARRTLELMEEEKERKRVEAARATMPAYWPDGSCRFRAGGESCGARVSPRSASAMLCDEHYDWPDGVEVE